jgi:ketosteroid isomerase-like protein
MSRNTGGPILLILGLSVISAALGQQRQLDNTPALVKTDSALAAAEKAWLGAYYRLDRVTLASLETEDFTMVTPSMAIAKADQLDMVDKRVALSRSKPTPGGCDLRSRTVRSYGTIALISDICTITETAPNAITAPGSYWQTQLWQSQSGTWKIVYLHISPLEHGM